MISSLRKLEEIIAVAGYQNEVMLHCIPENLNIFGDGGESVLNRDGLVSCLTENAAYFDGDIVIEKELH